MATPRVGFAHANCHGGSIMMQSNFTTEPRALYVSHCVNRHTLKSKLRTSAVIGIQCSGTCSSKYNSLSSMANTKEFKIPELSCKYGEGTKSKNVSLLEGMRTDIVVVVHLQLCFFLF